MYKVMVVDDEHIIRQGIISLIDWEDLECQVVKEAENGNDAYDYLKNNPVDIMVCDIRMPGKNGLEVAKLIRKEKLPVKVILLTAHSEFEYARQAIQSGVKDYVVKTDYIESLPEAVKKVVKEIKEEKLQTAEMSNVKEKLDNSMLLLQRKLVTDIINGVIYEKEELREQAEWCQFPRLPFYLVNFSFSTDSIWKISEERREKTLKAVRNFINLSLTEYQLLTVLVKETDFVVVVFCAQEDIEKKGFFSNLKTVFGELCAALKATLGIEVNICISHKKKDVQEIYHTYENIHERNVWHGFFGISDIGEEEDADFEMEPVELNRLVRNVIRHIENGFYADAEEELTHCVEVAGKENYSLRTIRSRAIDICYECRRKIGKESGALSGGEEYKIPEYQDISNCQNMQQLKDMLLKAIQTVSDIENAGEKEKFSPLVRDCMSYILEHYYERINIGTIAEKLYVNKSYLGTVFKKETGTSILETITRYRLDKAVELMQRTEYKLFEISERVGFDDPAYFTNVFTKYMGISPSAYRSLNQE